MLSHPIKRMKRANYYCSICFQGFTRKDNGRRHNYKLHYSQGHIIPLRRFRAASGIGTAGNTKFGSPFPTSDESKEELLSETLNRIGKEFEDCEEELRLQFIPSEDRAKLLASEVILSLGYDNPKEHMRKYLKTLRKNRLSTKIIRCVAVGLNTTPSAAKPSLIGILK
jgi:hypothetical protein